MKSINSYLSVPVQYLNRNKYFILVVYYVLIKFLQKLDFIKCEHSFDKN